MPKKLILGTSKWGDTVSMKDAMSLLDEWYCVHERGLIDTATNYPINGGGDSAIDYLEHYLKQNPDCDFRITVKIGSVSRDRIPEFDLSPDTVRRTCDSVLNRLQDRVQCIMVHWDNRSDYDEILSTVDAIKSYGLDIGISGIKDAYMYSAVLSDLYTKVDVQCKYSSLDWYMDRIPDQRYYAYKVSEGQDSYRDGLINAANDPKLDGILIGAKNIEQLTKSIQYVKITA